LAEAGVDRREIDKIFLTHLHSDHILSMPDILLTGWTSGRKVRYVSGVHPARRK
jgi:ribonuclease Z